MSKIGNYRVEFQESPDYKRGWMMAEQGLPKMEEAFGYLYRDKIEATRLGWDDYHAQDNQL